MEDPARAHDQFYGFGEFTPQHPADPAGTGLAPAAQLVFDDPGSVPLPIPAIVETLSQFHLGPLVGRLIPPKPFSSPPSLAVVPRPPPLPDDPGWSQDFVVGHEYGIHFGSDVGQLLATINQANVMTISETYLGSDGQILLPMMEPAGPALLAMLHEADALIPADLRIPLVSGDPLVQMIQAHDARLVGTDPVPASEAPVANVTYRDGVAVHGPVSQALPAVDTPPAAPDHGPAQVVHVGGNEAANGVALADVNAPGATRIVLGDHVQTDVIVQTNVLLEHLSVEQSGGPASLWIGHDSTTNVASMVQHDWSPGPSGSNAHGLFVQVDLLHGDVWNVKSLSQTNWLDSQGVAVETETQAFSTVTVGGNVQVNLAEFEHWTAQYDMIVVLGDYHSANLIYQTNVLYHAADVSVSSDAGSAQTIIAGGNSLTNIATIEHYGTEFFHPLGQAQATLAAQLAGGIDPGEAAWSQYAGSATGHLRVLAIDGDYYDVNALSQTNVMVSTEVGVLHADAAGVPQYVSAGQNTLTNEAHIVTSGAGDAFIGGGHYSDSLMIQANLVEPGSTAVKTDPMALVSEAVAFVGDNPALPNPHADAAAIHVNLDPSLHSHDLGSVMV